MSWITDNAVKRIFNTFNRLKNQIYDNDIESLKLLNDELKNNQKKYVNDNLLLLKLISIVLKERSEHYGGIKMAIKTLDSDLKNSLVNNLELLRISLNNTDKIKYLKSIGIDFETYNSQDHILKENEKEFLEKLSRNWSINQIENSIYNTTNEFLKDINNYK